MPRVVMAAFLLAMPPTENAAALSCAAAPFVATAGQTLVRAARSGSPQAFSGIASRYGDVNSLAMFALGPYRGQMPERRKAEYVSLTRAFIGRFLAKYSSRFAASGLSVTSCTGEGRTPTVTAKLSTGNRMVFRLYKTRRGYLVRDVNISSVWLGQQMRTTFTGVINRNGGNIESLFRFLRQ